MPVSKDNRTRIAAMTGRFSGAVENRIGARADWQAVEIAANIFRKLFHRWVTPRRLLAQRFQNNFVEVAGQTAAEKGRAAIADFAYLIRRKLDSLSDDEVPSVSSKKTGQLR